MNRQLYSFENIKVDTFFEKYFSFLYKKQNILNKITIIANSEKDARNFIIINKIYMDEGRIWRNPKYTPCKILELTPINMSIILNTTDTRIIQKISTEYK